MSSLTNPLQYFGVGIYSIKDAALLLSIRPQSVRQWMKGYSHTHSGVARYVEPLWKTDFPEEDGEFSISFRDLIEMRFVQGFRKEGLSLQNIRACRRKAQDYFQSNHPFSTKKFYTDGKSMFLKTEQHPDSPEMVSLMKSQGVFEEVIEQTFKDLDFRDDLVTSWRPYDGKKSIVIDPSRSFGQPIAADYDVPTVALADAVKAEGSVEKVANLYEVECDVVVDAVHYQKRLVAA